MAVDTSLPEERRGRGSGAAAHPPPGRHHAAGRVYASGAAPHPGPTLYGGAPGSGATPKPSPTPHPGSTRAKDSWLTVGLVAAARAGARTPAGTPEGRARLVRELGARFRLPVATDPAPATRYLLGVSVWAAALGLGGMAVGLRALVGFVTVEGSWYAPLTVLIGLGGLLCTIGAFASVHRDRLPWMLLGAATAALALGWIVTGLAG